MAGGAVFFLFCGCNSILFVRTGSLGRTVSVLKMIIKANIK